MNFKELIGEEMCEISKGLIGALFFVLIIGFLAYYLIY